MRGHIQPSPIFTSALLDPASPTRLQIRCSVAAFLQQSSGRHNRPHDPKASPLEKLFRHEVSQFLFVNNENVTDYTTGHILNSECY